ncbi:MAG: GYD domain-containing protein [Chloroflexi bacterium]|nr:GYD domain-containing protein [Chloroflexota bacterium]
MPVYLTLITMPDEGRKGSEAYAQRLQEINKVMDYLGVKSLVQYAILGPFDFVNFVEAPGDEIMAKLSIYLRSLVGVQTTTYSAIPIDNLLAILKEKRAPF